MLADYHVHSHFSDDCIYPMEEVVKDAIAMGLDEICFTDHVDYGVKKDWDWGGPILYRNGEPLANVDYPAYEKAVREMQKRYEGQIRIRMGLEFGVQVHTIPQYRILAARYPFDFIILSIHQVEDKEFWTQDFQQGRSQQEYNERYYEEMLRVVHAYRDYSVLGHMDLLTRYNLSGVYPFERVKPLVEKILRQVISDGKGIEVNTSSYRYGLSDTTPSAAILRLYRQLGGEIITIGSDSHRPGQLGAYLSQSQELLSQLGYKHFCTFEHRKPIFHRL